MLNNKEIKTLRSRIHLTTINKHIIMLVHTSKNDYATRHTLNANTLFILPSIDKAHMHILSLLQNLVELIDANTVLRVTTDIGPKTNHRMYFWLQRMLTFNNL